MNLFKMSSRIVQSKLLHICFSHSGGHEMGVLCSKNAKGRLERCDIWGNQQYGIVIESGADLMVVDNKIHENTKAGVLC